jgi:hypothetical protein
VADLRRKWSTIPKARPLNKAGAFHNQPPRFTALAAFCFGRSRFFELAHVLVRLNPVARVIENADHDIVVNG